MKNLALLTVFCLLLYENFNVQARRNPIKNSQISNKIRKKLNLSNIHNESRVYGKNSLQFLNSLEPKKQSGRKRRFGSIPNDDQSVALRSIKVKANDESPPDEQSTTVTTIQDEERADENQTENNVTEGGVSERSDSESTDGSERSDNIENDTETVNNETTLPNNQERGEESGEESEVSTQKVESERSDEDSADETDQTKGVGSDDNKEKDNVTERNIDEEETSNFTENPNESKTTEKYKAERSSEDQDEENDKNEELSITRSESDENVSGDGPEESSISRGSEDEENESGDGQEESVISRGSEDDENESGDGLEESAISRGDKDDQNEPDDEQVESSMMRGSDDENESADDLTEFYITRSNEDDDNESGDEVVESSITGESEDDENESGDKLEESSTRDSDDVENESGDDIEESSTTSGNEDDDSNDVSDDSIDENEADDNHFDEESGESQFEEMEGSAEEGNSTEQEEDDEISGEDDDDETDQEISGDTDDERDVYDDDNENESGTSDYDSESETSEYDGEREERDDENYQVQDYLDENDQKQRDEYDDDYENESEADQYYELSEERDLYEGDYDDESEISEYYGEREERDGEDYSDEDYLDENDQEQRDAYEDDYENESETDQYYELSEERDSDDYTDDDDFEEQDEYEDEPETHEYYDQIEERDVEDYSDQDYLDENDQKQRDIYDADYENESETDEYYEQSEDTDNYTDDINRNEYYEQIEAGDDEDYTDQDYIDQNDKEPEDLYNADYENESETGDSNYDYEKGDYEMEKEKNSYDAADNYDNYKYDEDDYNLTENDETEAMEVPTSYNDYYDMNSSYNNYQGILQGNNIGSNVLNVIEKQDQGHGVSIDTQSLVESEEVTPSPQLEEIMNFIENQTISNDAGKEDVSKPFYELLDYKDDNLNYEDNYEETDDDFNYKMDYNNTSLNDYEMQSTEVPDVEIGYDFNTLEYGLFSDLKTNQFNENILGLYTLRLGYYIRNNMINLLGFVMHQQFQDIGEDVFLQLNTIKDAFQQNLIDSFGLIPVLAQTYEKEANQQITAIMEHIGSQHKKRHCHISFSSKYIMNKLMSKKLDIRRIIAHLGYNPLTHKVFDVVNNEGIHEIKVISNTIQDVVQNEFDENLFFFTPVLKRIFQEIKEEQVILSEELVGYLLTFYPFPIGNFEITHALNQITMALTNNREFMSKCKIIPEETLTLVDQPIEFLTIILMKILDNLCVSYIHDSSKTLIAALLNNRLTQYSHNTENYIEFNALPMLLNIISFDKFPLEIVLARDSVKLYLDKILPFLNHKDFVLYNYNTPTSKLYAFLGFLLEQDPYINKGIKSSILAIKSHLIFHMKSISLKFDTLLELTNALLAPDLISEIKDQGRKIKSVLMDNMDDINAKIYNEPFKKCFDLDTCFVTAQNILKPIFDEHKISFNFPGCFIDRSKHQLVLQQSHLITINMLDLITPDMFLRETVEAAKVLKQYLNEKNFFFKEIKLSVECSYFKFILQSLQFILDKVSEIPTKIQKAIRIVITELKFKVLDRRQVDIRVIKWLKIILLNSVGSERYLHHFDQMENFLSTNENQINLILNRIDPKNCRHLLSCYNTIVDQINEVDLGYKLPYFSRLSPELNNLNLNGIDVNKFSVKTLLKIVEEIDEGKTCSSEITASKKYITDHENELNSILNTVSCFDLAVYECFDLVYETLLYEREKIPEIKLNILQFLLKPTICNSFKCHWITSVEAGSTILNPLLEYILTVMQKVGESTDKLHIQLDFFGLMIYLRKTNLNVVLAQYKLRPHVVEQTIITSFLNMVYELPETSKNIKISIENINNYLTGSSETYHLNSIMLIGLGRVLIKLTPSFETKMEINQYISEVYSREDDVINVLENLMFDCFNVQSCTFHIRNEFENKSIELKDIGRIILGIVAPKSCTLQSCNWLQQPAQRPKEEQITNIMNKIVQEGKNNEELGLAEKLALGGIKGTKIPEGAKIQQENNPDEYDEYENEYDDEYDSYSYNQEEYPNEYENEYSKDGDIYNPDYSDYDDEYDSHQEEYSHEYENEYSEHSDIYNPDYSDYNNEYDSYSHNQEENPNKYDDEVSQRLLISPLTPRKSIIFDDEDSKLTNDNDIFDSDQPKNNIDDLLNIVGDKDDFQEYLDKEMKSHQRTKRVKRQSNLTTEPTTEQEYTTTEIIKQSEIKARTLTMTRANLPSVFDVHGEVKPYNFKSSRSLEYYEENKMTSLRSLTKFNSVTLLKLIEMIGGNVDNFRIQKLIAKFHRELKKNMGEINYDLSQLDIDCSVLENCLWDLNDAILKNNLHTKPVFKMLLMIIRAEGCNKEKCPHKIEISRQKYLKFIDTFINELQIINNPLSNSFHFQSDIEFLIEFLKRRNVDTFIPKEIAFAENNLSIIKKTLTEMRKLTLPQDVANTVNNLFNLLYEEASPKHLHSENVISIIKAFIQQSNDTNVQKELMILKQKVEQKRVALTKLLSQIPVDCISLTSCVHSLEQKLINNHEKLATLLLRVLKPKSCIKAKCAWLKQSVQDNFVHTKSSIMKELRLWHDNTDSYLVKTEFQQFRYVIVSENLIQNFLSLGDFNYQSPLLGILLTVNPQIKAKYDMLEGVQMLANYMLTKNLPNRVTFRQLKHICQKLTTRTEYLPALTLMEQSINQFSNRIGAIKKNLQSIDVRCKTFRDCVNELIVGVNFKTDKTSKLIMEALSPSNCPKQKCPWILTGSKMYEKIGNIQKEFSKIDEDEIMPLIVKLRVEYIIERFELSNFTALLEDNDNFKDKEKYDFLEILTTISSDKNLDNSTKTIIDELKDYFATKKLSNILHDEDLQILIEKLTGSTNDILVKASMNVAKNVLTRYSTQIENILSNCTIPCIEVKLCVDQILLCARNSLSDNKDLITKSINPVQCLSLESCPWLNKIIHEETLMRRTFNFNRTNLYTKGMFPHDLIIFPPANEIQQAITFSLDHPGHLRNMIKIFPYQNDASILGKQLTVINVNFNETEHTIVFDFSIPGVFLKLQKVSGLRKPVINLRTFMECIIFIPILNNEMRALRIDLTQPGVSTKLKKLAANSIKKEGVPKLQVIARNRSKYDMYIDIFNQNFMNELLSCTADRTQPSDYSLLFFPSKLDEPWKALLGSNNDPTLWNVLDIFSTVSIGKQSENVHVTNGGITSFNFDIYNPYITTHLNSLWKFPPQLDARIDSDHVFYLPYKMNEFSSISLDLKSPVVIRKLEILSRFSKQGEHDLPTFQIVGTTDFPYGLNVSLNFDDEKNTKMFLSMMTSSKFDDDSIRINNVGVLSHENKYIVILWDLPFVRNLVKEIGQNTRFFKKDKKTVHLPENSEHFPIHINLDSPISHKLLVGLSKTTMITFEPIKIKGNENLNFFVMALKNLDTNEIVPIVIPETKEVFEKIFSLNHTLSSKKLRNINEPSFFDGLWTFDFEDLGEVKVNSSDPNVFEVLRELSNNNSAAPFDNGEVESIKEVDNKKSEPLEKSVIVADFDEERYNYLTILNSNVSLIQSTCNGSTDGSEITVYKNGTNHKFYCDLGNPTVSNLLSSIIIRVQSMPVQSAITVMQIPDSAGNLHPFIFDLNVKEVRKLLRIIKKRSVRTSSTNKVAIYYKNKLRLPEIFVIDYERIQFKELFDILKHTPCDLMPTDVLNPTRINDNIQNIDLIVFTIPRGNVLSCREIIPIILNPNDDITVREIELMEDLDDDTVAIPMTYKNGFTTTINVPYLNDESKIEKLKKLTTFTGIIKVPVLNTDSILALKYRTKSGKTYILTLNTTNDITKTVLNDLTTEAAQTVPLGVVKGVNGDNYQIRLDLNDENVQDQLKSVAITHMHIPESRSLLILKPKKTKTPIILDSQELLITKQLLEMAKKDKSKSELDVIQVKDTMGNRRILRIDLNDEANVKVLEALEGINAENIGPIFIPDNHKTIGLVVFKIIANSSAHSLVFNVSNPTVCEVLAELNDPTKPTSIPIPIYDEQENELVTYVDLWDENNLNKLRRLSSMSNIPEVKEPITDDSGIVVIPLEFTKDGVYVVECNVSDPNVTKKLFEIPGVIDGRKNPIYIPNPITNELTSLFFNPYDEIIVKNLREICPVGKFINPEFQNLLVDSFEDDDCEPETIILDIENEGVQQTLDEIQATKIVQNNPQNSKALSYRAKLKTRTMSVNSNVIKKFARKFRKLEVSYEPFVTTVDNKKYLIIGVEHDGTRKMLSYNLEDQSVVKALEELDFLSNGKGIILPTGPYKTLIININDSRIAEKLMAIYTLYNNDLIKIPTQHLSKNTSLQIDSDGGIVTKTELTSSNSVDKGIQVDEDYESYDHRVEDENSNNVGADIPDLPGDVLPDVDDYTKWQDLYKWLENNNTKDINETLDTEILPAGAFEIDPPIKSDDIEFEEDQDSKVNIQLEENEDFNINQELVLNYIPKPGSLIMFPIKKENITRIILLDLNDDYTKNMLISISDQVKLNEATQLFIIDDTLIKLNSEIEEILSILIEMSKAAKVKISPSEFPKVGGGYFLVFTIENPNDKEITPIVLNAESSNVVTKLKSLSSISPSHPYVLEIGSDEIILDLNDSNTLKTLTLISETNIPKEALKNIPMENGIFSKTLTLPVINDHNQVTQYVYNLDDSEIIDKLLSEEKQISQDETVLVLYGQKNYKTIPIKVNLKVPPSVAPDVVFNELLPQDVIIFFLDDEKGGTDVIVLDKQNENVTQMLVNYTKKRVNSDFLLQDTTSYSVFNLIDQDDFPKEIRLDITNKDDVALIKKLSQETKHPLAPFEMLTPYGYEKIIILSAKIKNEYVVFALNPNVETVKSVIKDIYEDSERDVFSTLREYKNSILKSDISEKLLDINKLGVTPLEVPIAISLGFVHFSLKMKEEVVKIYLDEKDLISSAREESLTSKNTQHLKFLTYDLINNLPKIVRIDTNFQSQTDLIKESSLKTIYPTMHKIYPPKSLENLLVYSIPNFEYDFNLTLNPNDQRVINIMDHNLKVLNFGKKIKFPMHLSMVSIPIKPEDVVTLNSFSPIQINPLTLIPYGGRAPILNVMVHQKNGCWNSFTLDPNNEEVYNVLINQELKEVVEENQYQVQFFLNQNRSEIIPVDFFDENVQTSLKSLTQNAPISVIWRRYKNSVIKICLSECIYLDLDLETTRNNLISISRDLERTETAENLPILFMTSQDGLQRQTYLPFFNQNLNNLDIKAFKNYGPIPEYYVTLQNGQELNISPIKVIKTTQNLPILMLDMKNTVFGGSSLTEITIDFNQPQIIELVVKNTRNINNEESSLFELQDVEGNIHAYGFDLNDRNDLKMFKEFSKYSLIQFKSNDLGLPTLIIDLIDDKLELNLNLDSTIKILEEVSNDQLITEDCYKIEVPQNDGYSIYFIDFNDQTVLNKLRNNTLDISKQLNSPPTFYETTENGYNFTLIDSYNSTWEFNLCLNDFFTADSLVAISQTPTEPTKFNGNLIMLTLTIPIKQHVFINPMSSSTLQTLKELHKRCTGEYPNFVSAETEKLTVSIDYVGELGSNFKFIFDFNNPGVVEGLKEINETSRGVGTKISVNIEGNQKMFTVNLNDPKVKRKMKILKDESLWGRSKRRIKRSILEPNTFNNYKLKKNQHLWSILVAETPQTGLISFNYSTENDVVNRKLKSLDKECSKLSTSTQVHLINDLNNPYSFHIDLSDPATLKELLIINKMLKNRNVPRSDVINKILHRFQSILIQDPFEKKIITVDTFKQKTIDILTNLFKLYSKGTQLEYFKQGQLIMTTLDTAQHKVKDILNNISTQTLIYSKIQPQFEQKFKLISFLFLENSTKPVVFDLGNRNTVKTFLDLSNNIDNKFGCHSENKVAYFEIVDDYGQFKTISIDLGCQQIQNEIKNKFKQVENVKITIKSEIKSYILFSGIIKGLGLNEYKTYKIPVSLITFNKLIDLEKIYGFAIKLNHELTNKTYYFNLDPTQRNLNEILSLGYLITNPKSMEHCDLFSIYVENTSQFIDLNLKNKKLQEFLVKQNEQVDFTKPIAIITVFDRHLMINLNDRIIKKLRNKELQFENIGTRKMITENVEKWVQFQVEDKLIKLNLGDIDVLKSLKLINQKQLMQENTFEQYMTFEFDDAWYNPINIIINPFDLFTLNQLINLGPK
ncbi:uncharacterized protein [Onthophagus taurus]|uniref:uncharacterized protein n=1 Tax=Onthophagus taurus TaxID=166361 RepID=UPI0039BE42FD